MTEVNLRGLQVCLDSDALYRNPRITEDGADVARLQHEIAQVYVVFRKAEGNDAPLEIDKQQSFFITKEPPSAFGYVRKKPFGVHSASLLLQRGRWHLICGC